MPLLGQFRSAAAIAISLLIIGCSDRVAILTQDAPWASHDATLILDHHTHSTDSDGALSPTELVKLAIDNGCDALALTDHTDTSATASGEQFATVGALRRDNPQLIFLHGLEVNIPSYGGREHATLLVHPDLETRLLPRVKARAESPSQFDAAADITLLQELTDASADTEKIILIYNHPSRKVKLLDESLNDILAWNAVGGLFASFEGGPGHQAASVPGDYLGQFATQNRWDPVVAEVNGVWDKILRTGTPIWGALASSDYHNGRLDEPPCAFARTHIAVPERSAAGILRGLRAGTFWADHGRMLTRFRLAVDVIGTGLRAFPGSELTLRKHDAPLIASVEVSRDIGSLGKELEVEFISDCPSGESEVVVRHTLPPSRNLSAIPLTPGTDVKRCSLRARVALGLDDETLFAYSNPVRLRF